MTVRGIERPAAAFETSPGVPTAAATVRESAVACAPCGSASPALPTGSTQARSVRAMSAVMAGQPELLVSLIVSQMRNDQTRTQENRVHTNAARAETAAAERIAAMEKARRAAEEASSFLGLSGIAGTIAGVAAAVAAVTATVATGGAAAAVAGVVLMTCADQLAVGLRELGLPEELVQGAAAALKLTGAVMSGGGAVAIAGAAAAIVGPYVGAVLEELGMDPTAAALIGTGVSLAGAAMMAGAPGGGGGGELTGAARAVVQGGRAVGLTAELGSAYFDGRRAEREHADQRLQIVAEGAQITHDEARDEVAEAVDSMRDGLKLYARLAGRVREMADTRAQSVAAAAQARA